MNSLFIFISLFFLANSIRFNSPVNQTQHWFKDQLINHFDRQDNRTYSQRYWSISQYFSNESGPVFVYICGEYTCPGLPEERQFPIELAKKFNALILVLEHRYYGASQPFGNESMKFENMKYLTINLALEDLAFFINSVKNTGLFGVKPTNPWITIGGSYPGALSAWFRYKYPHLTVGALASSAVVNTILNFVDFDKQIRISTLKSGIKCTESIQNLTHLAEQLLESNQSNVFKASFNAEKLSNPEFLFFFADIFVELVQYGSRVKLCDMLKDKSLSDQMNIIRNYSLINAPPQSYGAYYLRNETYDITQSSRQWTYQTCTEVGYFQTFYPNISLSMRSTNVTLDFYKTWCHESFGVDLWPNVELTNLDLGGLNLEPFNIILTNGGEDPWQWAGIREDKGNMKAFLLECEDCGHCVELYTPSENDSDELKMVRIEIERLFEQWIDEHWAKIKGFLKK